MDLELSKTVPTNVIAHLETNIPWFEDLSDFIAKLCWKKCDFKKKSADFEKIK